MDTSIVEIYVNGGEVTMTTRWYPESVDELRVSSSLKGRHQGWEMGSCHFAGIDS